MLGTLIEIANAVSDSDRRELKMSITITKHSNGYWRATIDSPPLNLFDQEMVEDLQALMEKLEQDDEVKIVVFDSADPDYFISHIDLARINELSTEPGRTGLSPWPDVAVRLENAPFVTVGVLRGRARGVGSEFLQALDIRFASRERAVLSQIEVGTGIIPGGGGMERLPPLIGRSRAMEAIIGADDFDADTAERYGWINRSVPDAELDDLVERFARRVDSFDRKAIALAKKIINERGSLPKKEDLAATEKEFFKAATWPETQATVAALFARGLQTRGELELSLGRLLA